MCIRDRLGTKGNVKIARLDTDKVKLEKAVKTAVDGTLELNSLGLAPLKEAIFVIY